MKIKTISIIAGILVILFGFSTVASANLTITKICGNNKGSVYVSVENDEAVSVENVNTDVSAQYGLLKKHMFLSSLGETIPPNTITVTYSPPIFGFGLISVTATVSHTVDDIIIFDDSETVNGIIFFHRILFNKLVPEN